MKFCIVCEGHDETLRQLVRKAEHRRARSVPVDLSPINKAKASRDKHRRYCKVWNLGAAA